MRLSLQAKVSVFLTSLIVLVSLISTYIYITAFARSKERGLVARGSTLNYSLSKAAEEGLLHEDLDLIKKASYIIKAKDVTLVQVYTNLWDTLDSYPVDGLKEPPDADAVIHFENSREPFYKIAGDRFDFYSPIIFKASEDVPPMVIGYARNVMSFSATRGEIKDVVAANILISVGLTMLAILAMNTLMRRVVVNPILRLHKSVLMFKDGAMPEAHSHYGPDEIGELSREFNVMSREIKDRERELLESEKRIKNLFERVEHAIFRLDAEGNIIEANKRFTELFGGVKRFCSLLQGTPDPDGHVLQCLRKARTERLINSEETVMDMYGNELSVLFSLYPDADEAGNLNGYDGYFLDITYRKRLEEQLRHAQKMEALGTLTGGVSHEFNNVLTAIIGFSEILQEQMRDETERRYVEMIHTAAMRAADLTRGLLAYSRRQITNKELFSLRKFMAKAEVFISQLMGVDIRLEVRLPEEDMSVFADARQIEQVLVNLAANGRDAMPKGGVLAIKAERWEMDEKFIVSHGFGTPGAYALISVHDTGEGIDEETKSKIFEPFFTTKDIGKGTGLGLSIVYGIIKQHGGYVDVESEYGKGTTFRVYLPLAETANLQSKTA